MKHPVIEPLKLANRSTVCQFVLDPRDASPCRGNQMAKE